MVSPKNEQRQRGGDSNTENEAKREGYPHTPPEILDLPCNPLLERQQGRFCRTFAHWCCGHINGVPAQGKHDRACGHKYESDGCDPQRARSCEQCGFTPEIDPWTSLLRLCRAPI